MTEAAPTSLALPLEMRPDRASLVLAAIFVPVVFLTISTFGGVLFAAIARQAASLGVCIILASILALGLSVFVGVLAQCGNLSTFWVEFSESAISYRGTFATTVIQSNTIRRIYIYSNFRYNHVLFFTDEKIFMIADLLWSSKYFPKLKHTLAEWCEIVGLDRPIDCAPLEKTDGAEFKEIMKITNRCLSKDWIFYALIFYFIASLPALGHFMFPNIIR